MRGLIKCRPFWTFQPAQMHGTPRQVEQPRYLTPGTQRACAGAEANARCRARPLAMTATHDFRYQGRSAHQGSKTV